MNRNLQDWVVDGAEVIQSREYSFQPDSDPWAEIARKWVWSPSYLSSQWIPSYVWPQGHSAAPPESLERFSQKFNKDLVGHVLKIFPLYRSTELHISSSDSLSMFLRVYPGKAVDEVFLFAWVVQAINL